MEITRADLTDDGEFADYYAVLEAANHHERPDAPSWSPRECRIQFVRPDPAEELTPYVGRVDGKVVAVGYTVLPLTDNLDVASLHSAVALDERRRGYGGRLLEHLVEVVQRAGRTVALTEAWVPMTEREGHPYRAFAEKHGFSLANVEIRRVLDLPVPRDAIDGWKAEAARTHGDAYRIELFGPDIPDRLLPSLCTVKNQLALDAPTGDVVLEEERLTPDVFLERRARRKEQGITTYTALAIENRADGEVVAFTDLLVSQDEPDSIDQWGTLVHRAHRGHRLGMAVKAANLEVVQDAHPEAKRISTCNAEANGPMVDINATMGFRPVELLAEFQRKLAPSDPVSSTATVSLSR